MCSGSLANVAYPWAVAARCMSTSPGVHTTLERTGTDIGVVERRQGVRALGVTLTGESSHAGTTAMPERRDALVATARVVEWANHVGHATGVLVTVGRLEVRPNSRSVVPGEVTLPEWRRARSCSSHAATASVTTRPSTRPPDQVVAGCDVLLHAVLERAGVSAR